jgi:RimJ/RimL family protein N-acetyltransferase
MASDSKQRVARPMAVSEVDLIIDYFHQASPEFLKAMGVDPSRLPEPARWKASMAREFALPVEQRRGFAVLWALDGVPVGFSSVDKIKFGQEAFMHLHILHPERRQAGLGAAFVGLTVPIYFETLRVERLFCEPYAFNAAPNRTLQRAGFKYVKTHETVPGDLNFHQPVTRWMLEKDAIPRGAG